MPGVDAAEALRLHYQLAQNYGAVDPQGKVLAHVNAEFTHMALLMVEEASHRLAKPRSLNWKSELSDEQRILYNQKRGLISTWAKLRVDPAYQDRKHLPEDDPQAIEAVRMALKKLDFEYTSLNVTSALAFDLGIPLVAPDKRVPKDSLPIDTSSNTVSVKGLGKGPGGKELLRGVNMREYKMGKVGQPLVDIIEGVYKAINNPPSPPISENDVKNYKEEGGYLKYTASEVQESNLKYAECRMPQRSAIDQLYLMAEHNPHVERFMRTMGNAIVAYKKIKSGENNDTEEDIRENFAYATDTDMSQYIDKRHELVWKSAINSLDMRHAHHRHYMSLLMFPLILRSQFCIRGDPLKEEAADNFYLAKSLADVPCMFTPLPRELRHIDDLSIVCSIECKDREVLGRMGSKVIEDMFDKNRQDLANAFVRVFAQHGLFTSPEATSALAAPAARDAAGGDGDAPPTDEEEGDGLERFDIAVLDGLKNFRKSATTIDDSVPLNPAFEHAVELYMSAAVSAYEFMLLRGEVMPAYSELNMSFLSHAGDADTDPFAGKRVAGLDEGMSRLARKFALLYVQSRFGVVVLNMARNVQGANGAFLPSDQRQNILLGHGGEEENLKAIEDSAHLTSMQARAIGLYRLYEKGQDDPDAFSHGRPIGREELGRPTRRLEKDLKKGIIPSTDREVQRRDRAVRTSKGSEGGRAHRNQLPHRSSAAAAAAEAERYSR